MLSNLILIALQAATAFAAALPDPTTVVTLKEDSPCRTDKPCCNFKLRIYERCIPLDNGYQNRVETWPLFYDFSDAHNAPIVPIEGDYNARVPDDNDPNSPGRIGNITGPNKFYMRWSWAEEQRPGYDVYWDVVSYWTHNPDAHYYENHRDRSACRFTHGVWSEGEDDHRKWGDDCRFKGPGWANRTRMRGEVLCPYECLA